MVSISPSLSPEILLTPGLSVPSIISTNSLLRKLSQISPTLGIFDTSVCRRFDVEKGPLGSRLGSGGAALLLADDDHDGLRGPGRIEIYLHLQNALIYLVRRIV